MLYLLGLGRMDSRNAPAGDADENIAVPNANILDASERFLSAVLPLSMRRLLTSAPQALTHSFFNVLIFTHERPIVIKDRCAHKHTSTQARNT